MRAGSVGMLCNLSADFKVGGRQTEPRIERLMDTMFLEDDGRDERQLLNGLSEFWGHASRSNGRTGFLRCPCLISAGSVHFLGRRQRWAAKTAGYE